MVMPSAGEPTLLATHASMLFEVSQLGDRAVPGDRTVIGTHQHQPRQKMTSSPTERAMLPFSKGFLSRRRDA